MANNGFLKNITATFSDLSLFIILWQLFQMNWLLAFIISPIVIAGIWFVFSPDDYKLTPSNEC